MEFKLILFNFFRKVCQFFSGKGLRKIPGVTQIYTFLFKFLWPNKGIVEVQGSKMCFNNEGLLKTYISSFQDCITLQNVEPLTTEIFKKTVKKGDVVVDIGANIGHYTLLAARLVGENGCVYAFEPEPKNYHMLVKNVKINSYNNVFPVQKAVSDFNGKVKLNLSSQNSGTHNIRRRVNKNEFKEFIEVDSVTLDEFFKDKNQKIDVIKMDVEGAEPLIFKGMKNIINTNENLKMFIEFNFPAIEEMGCNPREFFDEILKLFKILAIDDRTSHLKTREIKTFDELLDFCKENKVINLFLKKS